MYILIIKNQTQDQEQLIRRSIKMHEIFDLINAMISTGEMISSCIEDINLLDLESMKILLVPFDDCMRLQTLKPSRSTTFGAIESTL